VTDARDIVARPGVGSPPLRGGAGAWLWDLTAGRLWADDRFASLYGLDADAARDGLPGEAFFRGVHPDDALRLRIAVAGVEHGAEVFNRDYRLVGGGGGVRWVSARGRADHDDHGRGTRFSGLLIDISEQKRVEERLRIAQTAGGVGTFEYLEGFGTVTVSAQFCDLLGLHIAEALPVRTINGLVRTEDPPLIAAAGGQASAQEELRVLRADTGEERWIARRGEWRDDAEHAGRRFIGVIYDITEAKRSERKLRDLTETLEARVEARTQERDRLWTASRDLFAVIGADGRQRSINPAWTRLLGYGEDELLGRSLGELVHPDDLPIVRENWPNREVDAVHFDARLKAKDGEWRWVNWTVIPLGDAYYAVGRDLTERKQLEDQLRQSQKMEAVGQLTGGLAHDFNNMLTGVLGNLDMLSRRMADGRVADAGRFIEAASAAAARAASLTHRLLAFSRRQPLDPRPLDVNALVASMQDLLSRTLGEQVKLTVALAPDLWPAFSDANQLENAILNLAINARDAMPGGGALTIETENLSGSAECVALRVRDTGEGMSRDVVERAFEPFFTTKPLGQGTGLGLSMVYGFVRQTGGDIRIDSRPNAGTTVELRLPRALSDSDPRTLDHVGAAPGGLGETVLVVEDDASVRLVVVEVLGELGYEAIEMADTEAALKVLASDRRIDLLVTDVGLPGINGRQLADLARGSRPDLPVLFMTGYTAAAARRSEFLAEGMEMIAKPFAVDALGAKIREMIGG
jgi:PAS domain S-box-containing protein